MALRMSQRAIVVPLAGLIWAGSVETGYADEAFLCGPDTVVYVKPSELEEKKKSDACVARYFGLEVVVPQPPTPPIAQDKRRDRAVGAAGPKAAPVALKKLAAPETGDLVSATPTRTADAGPPVAAPGTDYRNVKIINASSPNEQWFKHMR